MSISEWADWSLSSGSVRWVLFTELLCLAALLTTVAAGVRHFRRKRRATLALAGMGTVEVDAEEGVGEPRAGVRGWSLSMAFLAAAIATVLCSLWRRYLEVNHFPSQTMSEVLTVFAAALLVSLLVLHFALGLYRRGPGWAILDDAMVASVLVGVLFTLDYTRSLSTAQRDLPPALQSYWFAPHISALIFSYATLGIAGVICLIWFSTRFWSGVFSGGRSWKSQLAILALLALLPFAHLVTLPFLALTGGLFFALKLSGRLPSKDAMLGLERELDDVSFRAFAVGMPFLTAGLWMGAFWAQEAWANYWGWDSKENSALITWLIYVVYIHLRMLGGYRGEKAMAVLMGGALSVFLTFQVFGYLPDSQKNSLHKYTDEAAPPMEGQTGPDPTAQARSEKP